ncbi:hypothetical protein ACP8Y2_10945 [Herpetosiphon llansteffanensis]
MPLRIITPRTMIRRVVGLIKLCSKHSSIEKLLPTSNDAALYFPIDLLTVM